MTTIIVECQIIINICYTVFIWLNFIPFNFIENIVQMKVLKTDKKASNVFVALVSISLRVKYSDRLILWHDVMK